MELQTAFEQDVSFLPLSDNETDFGMLFSTHGTVGFKDGTMLASGSVN